jgi:hypothetical protein
MTSSHDLDPELEARSGRQATLAFFASALALSVLLVLAITSVDYLSTSDGPQRLFAGQMLNHLHDADRGYDRFLASTPTLTDLGFELTFAKFEPWLGWRVAYQVVLCLIALLWAWGVLGLAACFGAQRRWLGLLGFASALQWSFYMGQFSSQMGTAIGFVVLAWAFRRPDLRKIDRVILAALLLLQVIVHAFTAVVVGGVLLIHALLAAQPKRRLHALLSMTLVGLPAAAVAILTLSEHLSNAGAAHYNYPPTPFLQRLILFGRGFVSGPWWRAWPLVALAAWGLARCIRARGRFLLARERSLAIAGLVLCLCAAFLPLHTRSWEFFSVRFTPYGVLFLLMLVAPSFRARSSRMAAAAAITLYSASSILWSWHHHTKIRAASADLMAALSAPVKRHGLRLPLPLEPPPGEDPDEWRREIPYVTTNGHMGALFALEQGGVPAVMFAGLTGQSLRWLEPPASWMPPRPSRGFEWQLWEPAVQANPKLREAGLIHYLSYSAPFEDVILHARPGDADLIRERGFVIDFQQGGIMIARFRGCPFALTITAPPEGAVPTAVMAGWVPSTRPTFSVVIPAGKTPGTVRVPNSPCGDVWVRVLFDVDGNGEASRGDRTCLGSDTNAVLYRRLREGEDDVALVCQPGPPLEGPFPGKSR